MSTIQKWLLAALIVLWPSNLFLKFAVDSAYLHGLLVDYLLPKLYLTDILIFGLFLLWLAEWWMTSKGVRIFKKPSRVVAVGTVSVVILFVLQLSTARPLAAFWFLEKIVEMVLLGAFLLTHRHFLKEKLLLCAVMVMLALQSLIGLGQFYSQTSVFPSYTWLGESRLSQRAGLARGEFNHVEKILPYGTTSHPNVLGGVVAVGLLSLWWSIHHLHKTKKHSQMAALTIAMVIVSMLSLFTLSLTQSWSAWLSLACGGLAFVLHDFLRNHHYAQMWGKAILSGVLTTAVLVPFVMHQLARTYADNTSFTRRDSLNQTALRLWESSPLYGVGLDQFTAEVENITPNGEVVRFVQPAHHVGLLILAEMGIAGIIFAAVFVQALYTPLTAKQRKVLWGTLPLIAVIFLPMATLDHFIWTQQIGQLTLVIGGVWIATQLSLLKE